MHIEYQGFDRRVGAQNTDTPETAGAGRDGGTASSPLSHHLAETGEFPFGSDALYIPSSPAHEPTSSHHAQHPNVKPDEVDEPAGLAAVAEIAALECALAEKERRLRALKGKVATQLADGCSAKGSLPASTAPPLLPAKRKAEEVTLGQPISCGPAAVAVGATTAPHLSHAMVCGAPHAAGSHASVSVPLPLGPATSTAAVVGVPIQQAEALRAQQLQLQATILAQAQGHAEEVATSMGDAAASTCMKHEDDADGSGDSGGDHSLKKQRLVWTTELHNRFINAITHLGLKHAVPKNILTMMNVEGMTRENVASHLQKYRMYLKKIGGYTDKDKVDPDTLQAVHEQNVQQMAAQQALQQSLAVMHGGYGYYGPESPTAEAGAAGSGGLAQQQQAQQQQAQQQQAQQQQAQQQAQQQQAQQQQAQQQAQQQQQAAVSAAGMPPPGFPMYQPPPQGPWPYGGSPYGGGYPQGFPFGMPPGFPPQPQWQAAAAMQQHAAQQAQQRMVQQAQHHAQQQAAGGKPSVDPNNFGWGWGNPGMAQQAQQLAQQAQQPDEARPCAQAQG